MKECEGVTDVSIFLHKRHFSAQGQSGYPGAGAQVPGAMTHTDTQEARTEVLILIPRLTFGFCRTKDCVKEF